MRTGFLLLVVFLLSGFAAGDKTAVKCRFYSIPIIPFTGQTEIIDVEFTDSVRESDYASNQFRLVNFSKDTLIINQQYTSDPHYICGWQPWGKPVFPGDTLTFKVCWSFYSRIGWFSKSMGFYCADGRRIQFSFSGRNYGKP